MKACCGFGLAVIDDSSVQKLVGKERFELLASRHSKTWVSFRGSLCSVWGAHLGSFDVIWGLELLAEKHASFG